MNSPLISVIIPVYKVEKYLSRCLESVVNQTYKNLEIILVDDGSPDNCPQMCDKWAEKDSRIKVLHKKNAGVANARNDALDVATGEYVGFVDSDDYIEPQMYEYLITNILNYNADISICGYQYNDDATVTKSSIKKVECVEALRSVALGGYQYGVLWNKLYKMSVISGIHMPDYTCSEDLVFNYYSFKKAKSVVEGEAQLYHYFINNSGIVKSAAFSKGAFDAVRARALVLEKEIDNEYIKPFAVRGLVSSVFVALSSCVQLNNYDSEKSNFVEIILKYRKEIITSSLYTFHDKIKTIILSINPKLYFYFIKKKYKKRV